MRFDAPDPRWAERSTGPLVVCAFLLGIRQDSAGRHSTWSDVRGPDGLVVGRQPPVRHFRLAYLLTAWASADGGADSDGLRQSTRTIAEHEALGRILSACAQTEALPAECVKGTLAESGLPTALVCAPAESSESVGSVWSGLGVAPRACVQLVLVAPLRPPVVTELAPPAREIVLNAWQEPSDSADGPTPRRLESGPARGTVRRWERQTRNEVAASQRRALPQQADAANGSAEAGGGGYTGA